MTVLEGAALVLAAAAAVTAAVLHTVRAVIRRRPR